MNITLKVNNDRYSFDISNQGGVIYASDKHYFLTPFIKSNYKYAWEACRDAWKLALKHPYHIATISDLEKPILSDASAEQMLINHYLGILRDLRIKAKGVIDRKDRKMVYDEVKKVISELDTIEEKITDPKDKRNIRGIARHFQKLIQKYFRNEERESMKQKEEKIASIKINVEQDIADEYAQKICKAIQNKHKDAYYIASYPNITVFNFKNEPLLRASINNDLNVDNIVPCYKLGSIYPLHSAGFYQKYFKPIVESLGHFSVGKNVLLSVKGDLPDSRQKEGSCSIDAWDIEKKLPTKIAIAFKGEKPIWFFEKAQAVSQYNKEEYLNAIVKCMDKTLESIYGRTGTVIQVFPRKDFIEVDVDFGRGIGIVRLTEQQIDIIPLS